MTEQQNAGPDQNMDVLGNVLLLLHDLDRNARLTADSSYQERRIEALLRQLPDEMRRVLTLHLRVTNRRLGRRYPEAEFGEKAPRIYTAIRRKKIRNIHAENLYDSILSTPEYPIHSKAYGISLLNRHLATMAIDRSPGSMLETYGWMSLDMNGVKGMVDCTTYQNVTHYLQAVAQFLLDKEGKTRKWLERRKVKVIPLAAGGDEYALFLDGEGPMSSDFFQETSGRYQEELAGREELARFLDFSDRGVRLEYGLPTEAERAAFFQMAPPEQEKYLAGVGDLLLPDAFIPTGGMGGANVADGVRRAVERGSLLLDVNGETLDSARLKIIQHTMELAEALQAENKTAFKTQLKTSNPKFFQFLLRNVENRRLDERLRDTQEQLAHEKARRADMERDMDALRALCHRKDARIEDLLRKCA
ncbi:MAG: hypothetical protein Q7S29_05375 [Candidatus Peribacter sp.]|nr:hypothetical protein [Candidatus Peribacter sp.]